MQVNSPLHIYEMVVKIEFETFFAKIIKKYENECGNRKVYKYILI
jgi:hypothetical protein